MGFIRDRKCQRNCWELLCLYIVVKSYKGMQMLMFFEDAFISHKTQCQDEVRILYKVFYHALFLLQLKYMPISFVNVSYTKHTKSK